MEGRDTQGNTIATIDKHLNATGQRYYSGFYVGITDNPERSLFQEHLVSKDRNWWMYVPCDNATIAKGVEKHYLDLGMNGSEEGGDDSSKFVYFYIITSKTKEKRR